MCCVVQAGHPAAPSPFPSSANGAEGPASLYRVYRGSVLEPQEWHLPTGGLVTLCKRSRKRRGYSLAYHSRPFVIWPRPALPPNTPHWPPHFSGARRKFRSPKGLQGTFLEENLGSSKRTQELTMLETSTSFSPPAHPGLILI